MDWFGFDWICLLVFGLGLGLGLGGIGSVGCGVFLGALILSHHIIERTNVLVRGARALHREGSDTLLQSGRIVVVVVSSRNRSEPARVLQKS